MDQHSPYDLVRKRETEDLTAVEAAVLEDALTKDADLAAFARAFPSVRRITGVVDADAEIGGLHDLDLEALALEPMRSVPHAARRWWIAAAALLAGVLVARGLLGADAPVAVFTPRYIDMAAEAAPAASAVDVFADAVPAVLIPYRPIGEGGITWLRDESQARALARVSGRPILRFGSMATCPLCVQMERGPLRAADVLAQAGDVIALNQRYTHVTMQEMTELFREGWPRLQLETADGKVLRTFHGARGAAPLARELALATASSTARPMAWDELETQLTRHTLGNAAGRADELGRAWSALASVEAPSQLAQHAATARRWIAAQAAQALRAARDTRDAGAARDVLTRAVGRFADSPFADDFADLLARLDAEGRLPPIQERSE